MFPKQYDITLRTNLGDINLVIRDVPSRNDITENDANTNIVMLFIDHSSAQSFAEAFTKVVALRRINPNIQYIVVNNKYDLDRGFREHRLLTFANALNGRLFDVSVKTLYNFDHPLLHVAKSIYNRDDVEIISILPTSQLDAERKRTRQIQMESNKRFRY